MVNDSPDRQPATAAVRLSSKQREELSDLKVVLMAAAHNVQAAVRGDEIVQAVDNALMQAEQAVVSLRRIQEQLR